MKQQRKKERNNESICNGVRIVSPGQSSPGESPPPHQKVRLGVGQHF